MEDVADCSAASFTAAARFASACFSNRAGASLSCRGFCLAGQRKGGSVCDCQAGDARASPSATGRAEKHLTS
eukprot:scaffold1894_cov120-Isochrysis_galbana.AAC.4